MMMEKTHKTDGAIAEARVEVLEELGSAAGLLREAMRDCEAGNVTGAKMCADDVVTLMAAIEVKASESGARLMKWVNFEND